MPLDPELRSLLDALNAADHPPISQRTPAQVRAELQKLAALGGKPEPVSAVVDDAAVGPGGDIPLRIYRPAGVGPREVLPILVWYHGGGWVLGGLDTADGTCRQLANRATVLVVSVDYRLAPEHPFPAGVDDAWVALQWVAAKGDEWGGDPNRLAVGGDSAGGNLAAVIALLAGAAGEPELRHQLLVNPVIDATFSYPSYAENATGYLLTREAMEWFRAYYLGTDPDPEDPRISPLFADDVSGTAPATVLTAEFDPLRDEGEAYGARLREAGVPVEVRRYDGMIHGFFAMGSLIPAAEEAVDWVAGRLREALE